MRREFSKRQRREIVARAMDANGRISCEGCGLVLGSKKYEIDHTIPEALILDKTRPLTIEDGKLLGVACCHRGGRNKTASDVAAIAKCVRLEDRRLGIRKPRGFPKPPPGYKHNWGKRYAT
jgi:hypothetical protein